MARVGLAKTNMSILRKAKGSECNFSSTSAAAAAAAAAVRPAGKSSKGFGKEEEEMSSGSGNGWWAPHPRTGIYVPKGCEWVIDDVPENAASFPQTYWLRNVDGVDKPDPDIPSPYHHDNNYLNASNMY